MPLVRYRTGDLASLLPNPERCECGLPLRKMSRVRGRLDDMLFFGGDNVYPDEFDRVLLSLPGVTDYQLVIDKESYKDVMHVTIETARREPVPRDAVFQALLAVPRIRIANDVTKTFVLASVDSVPPGALSAGRPKTTRIIDHRPPSVRPAPTPTP
jgi:phenylacetate-CoA ligase